MSAQTVSVWFHKLPDNLKGILMIMIAAMGFSLMVALIKYTGQRLHVTQILLIRQLVMTMIVLPGIIHHFPGSLKTARLDLQIVRVILALIAMLCGFYAVINMPLADATAIGFAKGFFVTILAVVFLHEKVGPRRWAAVIVGFIGVLFMLRPGVDGFNPIGIYALIGAMCAGFVMVIIRKLAQVDEPVTILSYQAIFVGICVAVPAFWYWKTPTLTEWGLMIGIGLVSYGAQLLNIYAYKWGEASMLASLDYIRLLYATFFGYVLFATLPGPNTWIGSAIIIGAALYTVHRERINKRNLARAVDARGYNH